MSLLNFFLGLFGLRLKKWGVPMMQAIEIRPDKIPEYRALHENPWPEVLATLHAAGVRDYHIGLCEFESGRWVLLAYFQYVGQNWEADQARIRNCPHTQKWWTHTGPCQEPFATAKLAGKHWADAEIVFDEPLDKGR
jgi:L-rhamnose mutarotase